jgi:alkylated DNA repair protein (DNA oxidative demethylase)
MSFRHLPGWLTPAAQREMLAAVREVLAAAPPFTPTMPVSGRPLSVRMTSCGALGWVSDVGGYRYEPHHPVTGRCWPPLPDAILALWHDVADCPADPDTCLVNIYDAGARMGLHQDRDEATFEAPIVSVSLGDTAIFRVGGTVRRAPTRSMRLASGDVVVFGGEDRLIYHGIDRVLGGSSRLLPEGGRINLTLRRVRPFEAAEATARRAETAGRGDPP